ncbi:MAG: GTP-binding protein [Candidatus Lokiarchaeota archaeon]|nr:GTP-binding protein [Candidatus Lokiarchaeota archaeon]MBD3199066.1 GTP-binding protein [Candidatus Lokiarchaeota archaeon]
MTADCMFKIIMFGDGGVGKTTLVNRFLTGIFKSSTSMTIGVDFHIKKLNHRGKKVSLQIWDFAGEDRFRFLLPSYVIGASGGLFLYDITRYTSLKSFEEWLTIFRNGYNMQQPGKSLPILMIGSKLDLAFKRSVFPEQASQLAEDQNLAGYSECSAKTGENVEEVFIAITEIMMKRAGLVENNIQSKII